MNAYQKFQQLAAQVTNEVIAELEQGNAIWKKPWACYGLPKNYFSSRPYGGFNAFYLHHVTEEHGYTTPYFLTFRQAQELGGRVRKGQKGTPVVYWKMYVHEAAESAGEPAARGKDSRARKFVLFLWTVFNIDQVEGVDFKLPVIPERTGEHVIESCQQVVDHYPHSSPHILHGGAQAYYAPARDTVQLPEPRHFVSPQAYHATLFHELIHNAAEKIMPHQIG